jgi:serine protease AprX
VAQNRSSARKLAELLQPWRGVKTPPVPRFLMPVPRALLVAALFLGAAVGVGGTGPEHRARLSDDLLDHEAKRSSSRVRVIVRGTRSEIDALARRHGLIVVRRLAQGAVVRANGTELARLAADAALDHVSGDAIVRPAMAVAVKATAADQAWTGAPGLLGIGGIPGVTGDGIGVAVIDSGIAPHAAVAKKVVANVSFVTGDPSPADAYGHGTHVAGIIAGSASPARGVTAAYAGGVAPDVQLVNVRVLGAQGFGYTSDVIAGIDWAIDNRSRYNIRVINLSLGHGVTEPAATDPLCQAVARAVANGIVVVVAAGNDGRSAERRTILGGISSPGNSPFAITVGALNNHGTVSRSDDTVAEYSSRGPTKYDFVVKPDLAAPGTRLVSLEAEGAYLPSAFPYLRRGGVGANAYMQLSGTSMSTPVVTGAVALLLQGNPRLGTSHVKLALQSGATYMPDAGLMGAGAGSLNIWASQKIAANGLSALTTNLVGGLVTVPTGASFFDAGTMSARLYSGLGVRLLSMLDLSRVWSNPAVLRYGDLNLVGLLNPLRFVPAKQVMWGEVAAWSSEDQILWGTSMHDGGGDQILWGTSDDNDQILWGTTTLTAADPR